MLLRYTFWLQNYTFGLESIGREMATAAPCGETTGVIVVVCFNGTYGASVGDSAAWLIASDAIEELTRGQRRKPLLGSGMAIPWGFARSFKEGTVIIASDGLWKYTSLERIESCVRAGSGFDLATQLVELVRLSSGAFQDDVAVITCRIN